MVAGGNKLNTLEGYIKRIRRLGGNDAVNGENVNSIIRQLQHNVDLLYSTHNSVRQDKNLSELLYGNLLDYDQLGYKRFFNGGRMDTVEKILSFDAKAGTLSLEEYELFDGNTFMLWDLDSDIGSADLVRNVKVPESLTGQKLLLGFKVLAYQNGSPLIDERFDVYVNNVFCGSGNTGIVIKEGQEIFKTIYGVYDLTSEERNLEIVLKRSVTNSVTPADYFVRVQDVYTGLHVMSNSSYELNFPSTTGPFSGVTPDVNSFYDFENVSVVPIPNFLFTSYSQDVSGSPYTFNITEVVEDEIDTYYVSPVSSGDGSGKDSLNKISSNGFFAKTKRFNSIKANFDGSLAYGDFVFDDGAVYDITLNGAVALSGTGLKVTNGSNVVIKSDEDFSTTSLVVEDSALSYENNGGTTNNITAETMTVTNGNASFDVGYFSMPIVADGETVITGRSNVGIDIRSSAFTNASAPYGFGYSSGPIQVSNHSNFELNSDNANLNGHVGYGNGIDGAISVDNSSSMRVEGIINLSTSSNEKTIVASRNSSVDIEEIQKDGGVTSFESYDLSAYSTFSTTAPISSGTLSGTTTNSYAYEF